MSIRWNYPQDLDPISYDCGFCGRHTGPNQGYQGAYQGPGGLGIRYIYVCTFCNRPTYFDGFGNQYPTRPAGRDVQALPPQVDSLYGEARRALAAGAPTAAVMACRKLLMTLAVANSAEENQGFTDYVDWLAAKNHIPPKGQGWVSFIKDRGNEANHEIPDIDQEAAERVLLFTEMLLRFNYELPAQMEEGEGGADV